MATPSLTIKSNGGKSITFKKSSSAMDVGLTVPIDGNFYQVAHDWQLSKFGFKPRQFNPDYEQMLPMPSTRMLWACTSVKPSDFIPMDSSWQHRLYELFRYAVGDIPEDGTPEYWYIQDPKNHKKIIKVKEGTKNSFPHYPEGTLKWAYMDFITDHRALTDRHSFDTPDRYYRDDVIGINMENPQAWMMKCLTFTGNIVNKLDIIPDIFVPNCVPIETFDYTKTAPSLDWILKNKPHLIWWTTEQSVYELPPVNNKRRWTVARFPQLKIVCRKYGIPEVGTPYFAIGRHGWNLIDRNDLMKVENGESYSPYIPEK